MPKVGILTFFLFAVFSQTDFQITHLHVWLEVLKVVSQVVVLVIAPYIAYKLKRSEEDRKQNAIKAESERNAMLSKIDKNTEVTMKNAQATEAIAQATGVGTEVKSIVMENSRKFDEWLHQYRTDTHPEKHIQDEEKGKKQRVGRDSSGGPGSGSGTGEDPHPRDY